MTALGISAGLCYLLSLAAISAWLMTVSSREFGINGNPVLLGASVTLLIAATFVHGLRSKLDELIAVITQRADTEPAAPPAPVEPEPVRDAAWLIKPKSKS